MHQYAIVLNERRILFTKPALFHKLFNVLVAGIEHNLDHEKMEQLIVKHFSVIKAQSINKNSLNNIDVPGEYKTIRVVTNLKTINFSDNIYSLYYLRTEKVPYMSIQINNGGYVKFQSYKNAVAGTELLKTVAMMMSGLCEEKSTVTAKKVSDNIRKSSSSRVNELNISINQPEPIKAKEGDPKDSPVTFVEPEKSAADRFNEEYDSFALSSTPAQ